AVRPPPLRQKPRAASQKRARRYCLVCWSSSSAIVKIFAARPAFQFTGTGLTWLTVHISCHLRRAPTTRLHPKHIDSAEIAGDPIKNSFTVAAKTRGPAFVAF